MRFCHVVCAVALCGLISCVDATRLSAQLVHGWGNPERMVIEGAKRWTPDELRDVLAADIDVIVAGHPTARLDDYPPVLAARLKDGYLHGGFAQVETAARLDEQTKKIVLTVDEGPQYTAGSVEVKGASAVDAAQLNAWLTSKQPDESARLAGFDETGGKPSPRWVDKDGKPADLSAPTFDVGKPVEFTSEDDKHRVADVRRALGQQGFHRAKFNASLVRDEASHKAALLVTIETEGPVTKIDRIEVSGSKRDSAEDVIRYLGLESGQTVTDATRSACLHKLWLSARYLKHDVDLVQPKKEDAPTVLKIVLVDYEKAPPLRKPFTPEEEIVLKCRDFSLAAIERGEALIVRGQVGPARIEVNTVKGEGALLLVTPAPVADGAKDEGSLKLPGPMLAAASNRELLCASAGGDQLLRMPLTKAQVILTLSMLPDPKSKDERKRFNLNLGAGYKSSRKQADKSPVALTVSIAPVAMLGMIYQSEMNLTTADGVLTIEDDDTKYRIDVATGRLLEWTMKLSEESEHEEPFSISIEPRQFSALLAAAEKTLGEDSLARPNAFNDQRPLSSTLEYLLSSPLIAAGASAIGFEAKAGENPLAAYRTARKLLAADVLRPIDQLFAKADEEKPFVFSIPVKLGGPAGSSPVDGLLGGMGKGIASMLIRAADGSFPRESWPWTLSRGASLVMMQKMQFAISDLDQLYKSEDVGPIGRLVTATAAEYLSGSLAARFATSGIDKLNLRDFRRDYLPFIDQSKYAGQIIARVAELLRELDDEEAAELGRILLGKHQNLLVEAARNLRENKDLTIDEALPKMLNHLWANGLSEMVAEQLKAIHARNVKLAREPQKGAL